MSNSQNKTKKPLSIKSNDKSYNPSEIKRIANSLLVNGIAFDLIGSTPEQMVKIAISQAKKIIDAMNYLDTLPNDDLH